MNAVFMETKVLPVKLLPAALCEYEWRLSVLRTSAKYLRTSNDFILDLLFYYLVFIIR